MMIFAEIIINERIKQSRPCPHPHLITNKPALLKATNRLQVKTMLVTLINRGLFCLK